MANMTAEEIAVYVRMHDEMSGPMDKAKESIEGFGKKAEETSKKTETYFDQMKKSYLEVKLAMSMVQSAMGAIKSAWDWTAGAVLNAAIQTADYSEKLTTLSASLGVTTDHLQELMHVAAMTDVSFDRLADGHAKLAKAARDAASGNGEMAKAFSELGVSVTDSGGRLKSADVLFGEVADALRDLESDTQRTALAMGIFGRSGAELLPTLLRGSDGIAKLRQEARDMGLVLDKDAIDKFNEMDDAIEKLTETWSAMVRDVVTPYAGAIKVAADDTRTLLDLLRQFPSTVAPAALSLIEFMPVIGGVASGFKSWAAYMQGNAGRMEGAGGQGWGSPEDAWAKGQAGDEAAINAALAAFSPQAITDSGGIDMQALLGRGPDAEMAGSREPGGLNDKDSPLGKLQELLTSEYDMIAEANTSKEILQNEHEFKISNIVNQTWKSREQQRRAHLGRLIGFEESFNSAASTLAQAGFISSKDAGRAQAIVSTYVGAAKALELPFPASLAAWAQVLATGKQAIKGVESASIGGGGGGIGGGGGGIGGSFGSGNFETAPATVAAPQAQPEKPGTIVNLTIRALNPAEAAETLAPEIEKIARDGRVSLTVRNE
jgi:hypothetical protein